MSREIKIFKSFEEQERYHLQRLQATSPLERLRWLYQMQQLTVRMRPVSQKERKIIVHKNGYTQ